MSGCRSNAKPFRIPGLTTLVAAAVLSGCASAPPKVPYPAFIQADELADVYIAGLPGVSAKQFAADPQTRRTSNRILLPAQWQFGTGAAPDKSVEIFVLAGEIHLADISLGPGGYAYLPAGSLGMSMRTTQGAELLYFLDQPDPDAVIQTPLIMSSGSMPWKAMSDNPGDFGLSVRELRADPGSGARTWLLKIDPAARQEWHKRPAVLEGYLVQGNYQHSECVDGQVATWRYSKGGYFQRPPGVLNGGPEAKSDGTSIWLLRTLTSGEVSAADYCAAAAN